MEIVYTKISDDGEKANWRAGDDGGRFLKCATARSPCNVCGGRECGSLAQVKMKQKKMQHKQIKRTTASTYTTSSSSLISKAASFSAFDGRKF